MIKVTQRSIVHFMQNNKPVDSQLSWELASSWLREAYMALADGRVNIVAASKVGGVMLPPFIHCYSPSETQMLLTTPTQAYMYNWGERGCYLQAIISLPESLWEGP